MHSDTQVPDEFIPSKVIICDFRRGNPLWLPGSDTQGEKGNHMGLPLQFKITNYALHKYNNI